MPRRYDIDGVIKAWPYLPGEISVRRVRAAGGRNVLQMRIELGLLQLEIAGRPDGTRPEGAETYFDYLLARSIHQGDDFRLSEDECCEADREFTQFYQRRMCWLALREFELAMRDADHNLAFMDFCKLHAPSREWVLSHEQFRPFVLFHRTQAHALAELSESGPEAAIEAVNQGLAKLRSFFAEYEAPERFEDDEMVERLGELREEIRREYKVGRTLAEQLDDAVGREDYEAAAKLRDRLNRRRGRQAS